MKHNKLMNLKDKLTNHISLQNGAATVDAFGVEVELEGRKIVLNDNMHDIYKYWSCHNDGSLRKIQPNSQCCEYVFHGPFSMDKAEVALEALFTFLKTPPAEVFDSYRTSIHVHVNYGNEEFRTIYNSMVLSIILDELMVSQNGDHRIGNNFCLRSKDALGQAIDIIKSIQNFGSFFHIHNNDRYSSINFASLTKFGSIEYRSLECALHEGRVMHWIRTLQRIKESARTFKNPMEIIRQFSVLEPEQFLRTILGPYAVKYLKVDGYDRMLHNGMRIAQDIAFCSEWREKE